AGFAQDLLERRRAALEHLRHAIQDLSLQVGSPGSPTALRCARFDDRLAQVLARAARDVGKKLLLRRLDRVVSARLRSHKLAADIELVVLPSSHASATHFTTLH